MQTAQELFLHELSEMLDAEHRILEILSEQCEESSIPTLQGAFQSHHKQTEGQIERLEQCFELIGEQTKQTECASVKGLQEERETMIREDPSTDILDVFNVGAAIKVERYEISSYESLIRLAEQIDHAKIVRLLKQSLREEEQTLSKMTTLAGKVKPKNLGSHAPEKKSGVENYREDSARSEKAPQEGRSGLRIVKKKGPRRSSAA